MTTKPLIHKCPHCPQMFATKMGLGSHLRNRHGLAGASKSSVYLKTKPIKPDAPVSEYMRLKKHMAEMKAPAHPAPHQCPLCGFQTKSNPGLSIHMRGHSKQTLPDPKPAPPASPLQCPECNFIGATQGGLALHRRKNHNVIPDLQRRTIEPAKTQTITVRANHHEEETHFAANGIPEATLALALGRFQGLCQSMANEFDLPPRLFTTRLSELIFRSQVR